VPPTLSRFDASHLDEAAELLAAAHARDRLADPRLPPRFERPAEALRAVSACWARPDTEGAIAHDGGRALGYLFADRSHDPQHGRAAWVRRAGHALGNRVDAELLRDLYRSAAPAWLTAGAFDHRAFVAAADRTLERTWFRLGFGADQSYALLRLGDAADTPPLTDTTIRRATPHDRGALERLSDLIARHQSRAPAWVPTNEGVLDDLRQGYGELVDDPEATVWLAERGGEAVGMILFYPCQPGNDDLLSPDSCAELTVASTLPAARGTGVGRALVDHGLAELRRGGVQVCLTDWHETNLDASRFWPRRGFQVAVRRLRRRIDERALSGER
jgi:ribosomal protein S18 acetylase RimI-like enzyme